jgi:hypothetical protein
MSDRNIADILVEMLEEMKLLTAKIKIDALQKFQSEFLNSELRQKMYGSFDGHRTLQEISSDIGCKINTLQIFAQQLVDKELVSYETKGNARIINKSLSKIAEYYTRTAIGGE